MPLQDTSPPPASAPAPCITCIGLGPGDPQLMTVQAREHLLRAHTVAYFRKRGQHGHARRIAQGLLAPDVLEHPLTYPLTTEAPAHSATYQNALAAFYDQSCRELLALARERGEVSVLCEGDPFLYGSFMHLWARLRACGARVRVLPGLPSMSACWHASGQPIAWGQDVLTIVPATLDDAALLHHIRTADALVIMKIGRHLPRVRTALQRAGRLGAAWLVTHASTPEQQLTPLADWPQSAPCPYFATLLIHGQGQPAHTPPITAPA